MILFALATLGLFCCAAWAESGPTQAELDAAHASTDWLLPNHDYAGTRYVDLGQINPGNAAQLRPVCIYQAAEMGRFLNNPLVYRGVMYITTAQSTIALDAATCVVKWRFDWKAKAKEGQMAGVGSVYRSRGVALKDGRLVRSTADGFLIALDVQTGQVVWERAVVDAEKFEILGMAPLVVEDLVIVGAGISEFGVKGWIGAFRLQDGAPVWRFNTVPDANEPGSETWSEANAMARGGGGVWVTPSLDRKAGLLYVAVGNPVPAFFGDVRRGANLYTAAMVVLDLRTGKLQWYRQTVPHDLHDWDLTVTSPLYTAAVNGRSRAVVTVGGKDGYVRALDRETQDELFAVAVAKVSNADAKPTLEGVDVCPGVLGGVQWGPPALDPSRGSLFVPAVDWCGKFKTTDEFRYVHGQLYMGGSFTYDPVDKSTGRLSAIDASTGAIRWQYESRRPLVASVAATSSGLVFTGELTGDFVALNASDGLVLYRFNVGGPIASGVVTYAARGRQYVAVTSGMVAGFWKVAPAASIVVVFGLP
jgi:alcohol dehydrogenase (cytochrome c)